MKKVEEAAEQHLDWYCENKCQVPSCEEDCYRNSDTREAYIAGRNDLRKEISKELGKFLADLQ
jgi:hypothetical protein